MKLLAKRDEDATGNVDSESISDESPESKREEEEADDYELPHSPVDSRTFVKKRISLPTS